LINVNNFESSFVNFLKNNYNKKKFFRLIRKSSLAILYYSSGTTGKSKIIEYPHSSMLNTQVSLISSNFYRDKNCHICFLPLSHTSALTYTVAYILSAGGKIILCKYFWSIKYNIWDLVKYYQVNYFQNVPTTIKSLLNIKYKFLNEKTKTIDFLGCGSATLPKQLLVSFEKKFKIKVSNLYGLSEAGPTHYDDVFDRKRKIGGIGKLLPFVKGQLFDEKNNVLSFDKIGEFGVKSKNLLLKYYNDKNFSKNYKYKSYFLTGDYLKKDKDNNYYFIDRKKDMIIKGGVNIIPSEIENVIKKNNMVKDVCVVAFQDEFYGEDIGCFVIKNKNFDLKKILHICKENLGNFKTPAKFRFIKKFPMNLTGKILKSHLRLLINS
jgi:long-chain acyl-CoA synthetase